MNQKIGIIIQARVGSSRLPNKIILPFYDSKCILELLIERFQNADLQIPLVIATTTNPADEKIVDIAKIYHADFYKGSENNVLQRFIDTANAYKLNNVIRVCADNPFLDVKGTIELIDVFFNNNCDYAGYKIDGNIPSIKTHLGLWGEIVSVDALEKVNNLTEETIYHEHVTNYVYDHPAEFKICFVDAPELVYDRKDIRLTLDTLDDFELHQKIYKQLVKKDKSFNLKDIIHFLDENPDYLKIMEQQIKHNTK